MSKALLGQGPKILTVFTRWEESHIETFVGHGLLVHELTIAIHEQRVAESDVRALLACHAKPVEQTQKPTGRIVKTGALVNRLIKAGYHTVATGPDGKVGMTASAYRKLWPKEVVQPVEYAGRFDDILLDDTTVPQTELVRRGNIELYVQPSECTDLAAAPKGEDGTPLKRYVAFVQLGEKNLKRTVEDCTRTFVKDEVGLVTAEGLHLPVQYEAHLRKWGVDLAGSRCKSFLAPCVCWFADARPGFRADVVRGPDPRCGSASRGSQVIAVA